MRRSVARLLAVAALAAAVVPLREGGRAAEAPGEPDRTTRLQEMRWEIERLRGELSSLEGEERSVLGDVERLGAELRLREAELREVTLRLAAINEALGTRERELARLETEQGERERYLAFRLRDLYKRGREAPLRVLLRGAEPESYLRDLEYAGYLTERDARILRVYREDRARLDREREFLAAQLEELGRARAAAREARGRAAAAGGQRRTLLARIQRDRSAREGALRELENASTELGRLARGLAHPPGTVGLDVRKFRGLLGWPAEGRVSRGFGRAVHPRFKTAVPHPGLDIEASEGAVFRNVFDGRVAFASWLRGYGLTALVDHGHGLVSVYAHGSALTVEKGQQVSEGQTLGRVGDTGSLRGPYLYFELREDGKPVDPLRWLRPR